jgi:NadR type nicotinamide-nucleotide adenylyltransferase
VRPARIVVTGSESTGKTTLAARLARHFGAEWVPEHGRAYVDALTRPLCRNDVEPIARGQLAAERLAESRGGRLVVLDTDVLSTQVYGAHYYDHAPAWIEAARGEHPADLYLLCDIDVPWVADPQRDRGDRRAEMNALFAEAVARTGVPFVVIRGGWEERFRAAVSAVEAVLARPGMQAAGASPRAGDGADAAAPGHDG